MLTTPYAFLTYNTDKLLQHRQGVAACLLPAARGRARRGRSPNCAAATMPPPAAAALCLCLCLLTLALTKSSDTTDGGDTWVMLACTSRFWFNYRHVANALSFYRLVKRLGVPDSQIVLMLADDMPCNARNARPGGVYHATTHATDLCSDGMEVDYKGDEVTVENFVRVLTGRHPTGWPLSKRLLSTNSSRVLLYMTGHGGDEFLKFHNHEEISSDDLAHTLEDMQAAGRFQDLFFIVDTCQGGTLFQQFRTPGVLAIGSSGRGENSFAHQNDMKLGVALVDRFTDASCEYVHKLADRAATSELSSELKFLAQVPLSVMLRSYNPVQLKSTPVLRTGLFEAGGKEGGGGGERGGARSSSSNNKTRLALTPVTHYFAQSRRVRLVAMDEEEDEENGDEEKSWSRGSSSGSRQWQAFPVRGANLVSGHGPPAGELPTVPPLLVEGSVLHVLATLAVCVVSWAACRIQ